MRRSLLITVVAAFLLGFLAACGAAGLTGSDETTFPAAGGPALTFGGGFGDSFVTKVNRAGTALDSPGVPIQPTR